MKKWKKGKYTVTLIVRTAIPLEITRFARRQLKTVGNDVAMGEHNTLGDTSCSRRINKEREVLLRVDLAAPEASSARNVADRGEVLGLGLGVTLVSNQDNVVVWDADLLCGSSCDRQDWQLGDKRFRAGVSQLECKFFNGVRRVGWRNDATCPERAVHDDWSVDTVGGV